MAIVILLTTLALMYMFALTPNVETSTSTIYFLLLKIGFVSVNWCGEHNVHQYHSPEWPLSVYLGVRRADEDFLLHPSTLSAL